MLGDLKTISTVQLYMLTFCTFKYCIKFSGWGGEDDDFSLNRLSRREIPLLRQPWPRGKYESLKHRQSERTVENERKVKKDLNVNYEEDDGLKNLRYKVLKDELTPLYRRILVDL